MRARYRFLTTWILDAPCAPVWEAILDVDRWPEWWRGVEHVEMVEAGDDDGVGCVYRHRWRSVLPYTVQFDLRTTRVEPTRLLEATATGELEGVGRWRFYEGAGTAVTYEWTVETSRAWMNLLTPVARPIFVWSHNAVMRWGGESLAKLLDVPLLARS